MTPSLPLPPAAPEVVASAVEGLTGRLRGRLDAAVASLTDAPVTTRPTDDGAVRVRCGEDVWVTLTPGPDGALTRPEQAVCTCLLSPRCLHRAAVLTACPVSATHHATAPDPEPAPAPPPTAPAALSARRTRAATGLWTAAAAVLAAGTSGAGAVLQSELLRAAHTARLADLHRAEAAALDVVRRLRDERDPHGSRTLTALTAALRELLLVTHRLRNGDTDPALIGTARRNERPEGPLRLYGVCREPVIGPADLGGVVTHFVDDGGRWYTLRDVRPGGPARALRAGTAHVAIRSFLSDHVRLSRGGLVLTDAVISPDGRLLPEPGVRATFAAGRPWPAPPHGTEPAGAPTIRDIEIHGADGTDVLARVLPDGGNVLIRPAPAHRHPRLLHTANLRRLGAWPGLRLRVAGRLGHDRVTTLRPLAVAPLPGTGPTLRLPPDWHERADLGYDELRDDHFPPDPPRPSADPATADAWPLWRVRRLVELAVAGGRRAVAEPARDHDRHGHLTALRRGGFTTGADLATALATVAAHRTRDPFGRLDDGDHDRYALQWLATAVYLTGAEAALRP
ncbi:MULTISPECIES: SWIM zinc finger family protein [unclassified Streptomyces]|uniref:SWIM zinc finger family protein n=1 Tax=unclassified Streptomyces TaxID=2593676 RepID=UPI000F6F9F4D|nr:MULTISPECIES: SWIM zinc finger family protein [unclassified Streptomyces]AZM58819.1 hypothetical protein DLM49_03895 [Streptomyces sp. WAC 01438]RSM91216.1 hypothetical protein DMA10_27320 [Streptomyces sp. WAC 01420]